MQHFGRFSAAKADNGCGKQTEQKEIVPDMSLPGGDGPLGVGWEDTAMRRSDNETGMLLRMMPVRNGVVPGALNAG